MSNYNTVSTKTLKELAIKYLKPNSALRTKIQNLPNHLSKAGVIAYSYYFDLMIEEMGYTEYCKRRRLSYDEELRGWKINEVES